MSGLGMHVAGCTHVGQVRKHNEDRFELSSGLGLAVVCDGMGGHGDGEIASQTAVEAIFDFILEYDPSLDEQSFSNADSPVDPAQSACAVVRQAVVLANRRLHSLNEERDLPPGRGMGTTAVGIWLVEGKDQVVVFHVGDSRAYLIRNGVAIQLTRDHSVWQVWADNGRVGAEPRRNLIIRALGVSDDHDAAPDITLISAFPSDVIVLCSDGLHSLVSDKDIAEIATQAHGRNSEAMSRVAESLVEKANQQGGTDNVTVVVAAFEQF
ncbi:PPM family protein phosphatase [Azospirillaceae bacterium]